MEAEKCFKGFAAGEGSCCCNCKWQRKICGHPWNKTEAFKGSIMQQIAWGCTIPDMGSITLMEREHSLCEMHQHRQPAVSSII